MSLPSDQDLQNMQAAVDKLGAAQLQAQADVNGWFTTVGASVLGTGSSQDAQNTALAATNNRIAVISSTEWNQVFSGDVTVSQFLADAQETFNTIQSVDSDVGNWSLNGVIAATVSQSLDDAKKALPYVGLGLGTIAAIVAALFFLVYVAPLTKH